MKLKIASLYVPAVGLMLVSLFFFGCKSTPKVDWNSRVGAFTYDQAVAELGPPDRTAKLSDGKTVAEWIKRGGGALSFGVGTGFYGSHSAVGVGQGITTAPGDHVLRLVFSPENKLESWSKH